MNELPYHVIFGKPLLYAEDSAIICRNKNVDQIRECQCRQIEGHDVFLPQGNLKNSEINITLNNTGLEVVKSFKYLGITVDRYLNFSEHAKIVKRKVYQRAGLLW